MSSGLNASAQRQQETTPTPSPGAGNFDTTASTTSTSEESESTSTGAWEMTNTGRNPIDRFVESTSWSRQDLDIALSAVNVVLFLAILYIQKND
ncbi:hypothetical protein [Halocalculus aciditolerans]|uniref:Uncharacterized protein n=1 Tax=Halocalculus aciditolerans TaxID=1383812 RepID=A0A830FIA9_9EURY|nr:hypothetical protein [Halocalculus aciditolerans]GGL57931.1 hypothetical protein GCM10009039_15150 [Halocalculus aciditolerans]